MPTLAALGLNSVQIANPLDLAAKGLSLKALANQDALQQYSLTSAQRQDEQARAVADAWQQSGGDRAQLEQRLMQAGAGGQIPALRKQFADAESASTGLDEKKLKLAQDRLGAYHGAVSSVLANPEWTDSDVVRAAGNLVAAGVLPQDQAMASLQSMPWGNRKAVESKLRESLAATMDAKTRLDALAPKPEWVDLGGRKQLVSVDRMSGTPTVLGSADKSMDPYQMQQLAQGGQRIDLQERQLLETQRQNNTKAGIDAQKLDLDRSTAEFKLATAKQAQQAKQTQQAKQMQASNDALNILSMAEPLIDKATGSFAGAGADWLAKSVGKTTPGYEAAAQLKALEGALMMKQPRMEGPQSDKDVALYRQMAGKIGDPTEPPGAKRAAIAVIRQMHEKYAGGGDAAPMQAPQQAAAQMRARQPRDHVIAQGRARGYSPDEAIAAARANGIEVF